MTETEKKIRKHAASLGYTVRDITTEQMQEWVGDGFWMACCWQTQSIYVAPAGRPELVRYREFTLLHEIGHAQAKIEQYGRPDRIEDVPPVRGAERTWPDYRKQACYLEEQDAWDRAHRLVRDLDLPIPEELQQERRKHDLASYREFFWPLTGDLICDF